MEGPALGAAQGLEKTLHTENKLKTKIKDFHNNYGHTCSVHNLRQSVLLLLFLTSVM